MSPDCEIHPGGGGGPGIFLPNSGGRLVSNPPWFYGQAHQYDQGGGYPPSVHRGEAPLTHGFFHPILAATLQQKPQLRNKYEGGWKHFAKEWDQHLTFVRLFNRGLEIPDILLLEILRTCLDETDQKFLQLKLDQNPGLSFFAFWHMLESMYDKESPAQNRLAWEAVRLPPGDLTLE